MFHEDGKANVYGVGLGCDFPAELVRGLLHTYRDKPPEALARVQLFVNTRRMARRVQELFAQEGALLLPQISLISDLSQAPQIAIPKAVSPLRRRLELSQLIKQLLDAQPDLASRSSLFDLADSLAELLDEMQGENVTPEQIVSLDVTDQSGHWERALEFIKIVERFFGDSGEPPDAEARQRLAVDLITQGWKQSPPENPIILAGSTGSRGTTFKLMQAVAALPRGAVILPGFDFTMPESVWSGLDDALSAEDHPQYRFYKFLNSLNLSPTDVSHWGEPTPASTARNALISLALRPAPVTDQWMDEGPNLTDIAGACAGLTLVEAPSSRAEVGAIALRLREAAETGQKVALISPDRVLTRQVTATLAQWDIEPDDSAGSPLGLAPPGRFLRQVASLFGSTLTSEALLSLLKHPITNTGGDDRGPHLLFTRELELHLRRYGPPYPTPESLRKWAIGQDSEDAKQWAEWICSTICPHSEAGISTVSQHLDRHVQTAIAIAQGPNGQGAGALWDKAAGEKALKAVNELEEESGFGGDLSPRDYGDLFKAVLNRHDVRDPIRPHPNIMIWGTMEARVQGADLVILAGLNEGVWPEAPKPDPWLNRQMRQKAGLLLPERRIGLAAHDFQQAVCGPEVWITRSIRNSESQTVPSRWLNRVTNLLEGLPNTGGTEALDGMRARGEAYLSQFERFERPEKRIEPAKRPSPRPPVPARPRGLSVTRIKTLIRDPYAIYAQYVLKLKPLDPLKHEADAPLRGTILHEIFEKAVETIPIDQMTEAALMEIAGKTLEESVPWPAAQRLWYAKFSRNAEWFVTSEKQRQARGTPTWFEKMGKLGLNGLDFMLSGRADRIDLTETGNAIIYDYKTTPPSPAVERLFDKQLLLEAAMVENGGFEGIGAAKVQEATYIGVGAKPGERSAELTDTTTKEVWDEFHELIGAYFSPQQGYTSRRATSVITHYGDYDHLARYGEWEESDEPVGEDLT
ncbi:double-strand break repair protein AddB [Halocynthiibacter sp. C4]|uniref:double-strand break repair protein AddB n=1 Tax=Halocynthiibacter sp. C4 TaxID=2992758 RepID=UPI00237BB016|nr:double-strand break repair protein AddB [Halocynthiibacter sp. C4]MDE0591021.1 double-strand break repair protein AddB [Halocynthiibacter sp. C4]